MDQHIIHVRAAELLTALPSTVDRPERYDGTVPEDSQMSDPDGPDLQHLSVDPEQARLEAQELPQYLLAKSYFDCKEFDRCAAVFLKDHIFFQAAVPAASPTTPKRPSDRKGKGKATTSGTHSYFSQSPLPAAQELPVLSQKALFISLYAKLLAGEKRKDEDSEMVLGPADSGTTVNKELVGLAQKLDAWCVDQLGREDDEVTPSQGWLEFL